MISFPGTFLYVSSLTTSTEATCIFASGEFQGNLALGEFPRDFALNETFPYVSFLETF